MRVVAEPLNIDARAPYPSRVAALKRARIAVWDVLRSCVRTGSLDSTIEKDSEIANDFDAFFKTHRKITRVFFNGAKAEESFRRHVFRELDRGRVMFVRLPSTSPAYASLTFGRKLGAWRAILKPDRLA